MNYTQLLRKLAWFVGIWLLSIGLLAVVAFGIRAVIT